MKDFDQWNRVKKTIEFSSRKHPEFVKKGEIWFAIIGINIGSEQDGVGLYHSRPVLVIKKVNDVVSIVLPLSKKQKQNPSYFNFTDPNREHVSVIFSQVRALSIKRFSRKMYVMQPDLFEIVLEKFKNYLF